MNLVSLLKHPKPLDILEFENDYYRITALDWPNKELAADQVRGINRIIVPIYSLKPHPLRQDNRFQWIAPPNRRR